MKACKQYVLLFVVVSLNEARLIKFNHNRNAM
ncbi:MAG: hypothetical protein ACI9VT_001281, partial [Psychroserpens sp.]